MGTRGERESQGRHARACSRGMEGWTQRQQRRRGGEGGRRGRRRRLSVVEGIRQDTGHTGAVVSSVSVGLSLALVLSFFSSLDFLCCDSSSGAAAARALVLW